MRVGKPCAIRLTASTVPEQRSCGSTSDGTNSDAASLVLGLTQRMKWAVVAFRSATSSFRSLMKRLETELKQRCQDVQHLLHYSGVVAEPDGSDVTSKSETPFRRDRALTTHHSSLSIRVGVRVRVRVRSRVRARVVRAGVSVGAGGAGCLRVASFSLLAARRQGLYHRHARQPLNARLGGLPRVGGDEAEPQLKRRRRGCVQSF